MNFQKLLWVIAGAEPSILENCKTDYKKFSSIGATILMTSFIAFCAGTCAAWYFTQDGENLEGALGWSLLFGLIWALLIFCIDRSLVITLKKDPTRKTQKFWVPLLSRAALACIIAFMVSIPLELFIFKDYINENIENFKEGKAGQLGDIFKANSGEDVINGRINAADSTLSRLEQTARGLSNEISSLQTQINNLEVEKRNPNSSAYNSAKSRYNNAQQSYNNAQSRVREEQRKQYPSQTVIDNQRAAMSRYRDQMNAARADMNSAAAEWRDTKQRQIDELVGRRDQKTEEKRRTDGNYDATLQNKNLDMQSAQAAERSRRESEEIKKTQMEKGNKFLLNFQILEYAVWQRDKNGNLTDTTQLCFLWLIRLLFFIIEILPTVVKIVTPVGSYDRVVYAQEKSMKDYLDTPEFLDSMREIHKSELQTQLEEAKLRQEAELQMKKDILEKMTAAQIDVANLAIAKWEENERKKFTGKDGAGTTDPSDTATGLDTDISMSGIATVINSNSSLS
ncbi:DUF4407 domain-containing protein [Bacteroides acidifaciens]|uniref:DUF4407 domain-containing protein n=1 Tax=Bacteroides acidifaciens TaxID=85831 RepID=UPI0026229D3D|nr:DUF4407 domain-containing protein [Bacteroides acidifaciens]